MSVLRKCPACQTWNTDNDYCSNCGVLLNYEIQRQIEEDEKDEKVRNRPKSTIEDFLFKLKTSKSIFGRLVYYVLNSIWFVLMAILSFIGAIIALGNG